MTDEKTLRIYLSESNRGEDWEWTCGDLHICMELIFGEGGDHLWDTMETPIQAINTATGNSMVFCKTWHGKHSMKYVAFDPEWNPINGIDNIPMTIWKNRALFKHLDAVMIPRTKFVP